MQDHRPPNFLFKYYPPQRMDVLESLEFTFSRPTSFNDPFELNALEPTDLRFESDEAQAAVRRAREVHGIDLEERMARYFQAQHLQRIEHQIGILCLSATNQSLLMWAHYAASHTGFLMQLEQSDAFFETTGSPQAVHYVEQRPIIDYDDDQAYMRHMLTKSSEWSYEAEYRIVASTADLERPANPTNPADASRLVRRIDPRAIRTIICGCRMSKIDRAKIVDLLKAERLAHVSLLDSKTHTRAFAVAYG